MNVQWKDLLINVIAMSLVSVIVLKSRNYCHVMGDDISVGHGTGS